MTLFLGFLQFKFIKVWFSLFSCVDHLFNLKFAVKELERNSKKCEKEEKAEKLKTKKAIQKGNMEVKKLYLIYLPILYILKSFSNMMYLTKQNEK